MNKALKGFLIGLFILIVTFVLIILIWGSIKGMNFIEVIKSWFPTIPAPTPEPHPGEEVIATTLSLFRLI